MECSWEAERTLTIQILSVLVPEPRVPPTAPSTLPGPRVSHSSSENSDAKLVALTASATLDFSVYSITWPHISHIVSSCVILQEIRQEVKLL